MSTRRKPRVIDLFAGAGLLSSSFQREGFVVTRAIEMDSVAVETYQSNLGEHVELADVKRVAPEGDCDVLVAGPPCQGFSTLGKRDENDPRNALSFEVVKWARKLEPQIVVIENVAAFVDSPTFVSLKRRFRRAGFEVYTHVLNAYDYGVPQTRARSFTIASRMGNVEARPLRGRKRIQTVREAWKGLSREPNGRRNHYAPEPSELALARMKAIPIGGDKRDIMETSPELAPPSWWRTQCEVTDAWGRLRWNGPSNTLRTALQNASKGRYIHPEQNRVISLREAARLHSIEDSWEFCGLPTQVARQIGNSVPPLLGRAMARAVYRLIDSRL